MMTSGEAGKFVWYLPQYISGLVWRDPSGLAQYFTDLHGNGELPLEMDIFREDREGFVVRLKLTYKETLWVDSEVGEQAGYRELVKVMGFVVLMAPGVEAKQEHVSWQPLMDLDDYYKHVQEEGGKYITFSIDRVGTEEFPQMQIMINTSL